MAVSRILRATLGVVLIGSVTQVATALGQEASLTGTWSLSALDSDFGNVRAPESATLDVRRADTKLEMTSVREFGNEAGAQSVDIEIEIDGTPHSVETERGTTLISAKWEGDVLVVWRHTKANVGDVEITDRYNLVDAGARLHVAQSIEIPGRPDTFEATLVYDRQ